MNSKFPNINNNLLVVNDMPVVTRRTITTQTSYPASSYDDYGVYSIYPIFPIFQRFTFFLLIVLLVAFLGMIILSAGTIIYSLFRKDKFIKCSKCGAKITQQKGKFPPLCPYCKNFLK